MPNVYIIQRPTRDLDYSSAVDYGAINFVIEDSRFQASKQPGVARLLIEDAAIKFNPEEDYLLSSGGDWCATALMGMALNRHYPGKPIKILRWERRRNEVTDTGAPAGFYTPSTIRM